MGGPEPPAAEAGGGVCSRSLRLPPAGGCGPAPAGGWACVAVGGEALPPEPAGAGDGFASGGDCPAGGAEPPGGVPPVALFPGGGENAVGGPAVLLVPFRAGGEDGVPLLPPLPGGGEAALAEGDGDEFVGGAGGGSAGRLLFTWVSDSAGRHGATTNMLDPTVSDRRSPWPVEGRERDRTRRNVCKEIHRTRLASTGRLSK